MTVWNLTWLSGKRRVFKNAPNHTFQNPCQELALLCAGINRHDVENERVSGEGRSRMREPLVRICAGGSGRPLSLPRPYKRIAAASSRRAQPPVPSPQPLDIRPCAAHTLN